MSQSHTTPMPVIRRIEERTISYSWRAHLSQYVRAPIKGYHAPSPSREEASQFEKRCDNCLPSTQMKEPEFVGGIPGTKVIAGKDAILRCVVENLGDYKISWGVVNQKDQLSIGTNVFKGKDRIHVTHSNNSWYLHIKNVTQNDTGYYICQISTNPIKTQAGHLDVVGICKSLFYALYS
ncbi:ig-like domain-containing protein [Trichonephila clavipes]|nr:ig-like domain-containing protein [Trichonephila clavipes]